MYICVLTSTPDENDIPYDPSPYMNGYRWKQHLVEPTDVEKQIKALVDEGVDVFVVGKRLAERRVAAEVSQDPQLNLRIVGCEEFPAIGAGTKGRTDFATFGGTDWNVLQIRITGTEPPGGSNNLIERGMHAACGRIYQLGQRVDIRVEQFRELAILDNLGWQRV